MYTLHYTTAKGTPSCGCIVQGELYNLNNVIVAKVHYCSCTCGMYPMSTSMLLLSLAPYSHSMSTFRDLRRNRTRHTGSTGAYNSTGTLSPKVLPVVRDVEVEVSDMRCVFREDDVTSELAGAEPEGEVRNIVELELCMNPAEENKSLVKILISSVPKRLSL